MSEPSTFTDPDNYPAIVLSQPCAGLFWLSAFGWPGKLIESRTRRITYRGPLVICAGQGSAWGAMACRSEAWNRLVNDAGVPAVVFDAAVNARGCALAKVWFRDCRPFTPEDCGPAYFTPPVGEKRRFAWVSHSIAALEPFLVKGTQGFFRVPRAQVDAAVLAHTIIEGIQ